MRDSFGLYTSSQKILIVGDGDFSFSASLCRNLRRANSLVCTSLDSYEQLVGFYGSSVISNNIRDIQGKRFVKMYGGVETKREGEEGEGVFGVQ